MTKLKLNDRDFANLAFAALMAAAMLISVGCGPKGQAVLAAQGKVVGFRVDCGAIDESKPRRGQRVLTLTADADLALTGLAGEVVLNDVRTKAESRKWSVFFEGNHDGDAIQINVLKTEAGEVDGFEITDREKERAGRMETRRIAFRGVGDCLKRQGGKSSGRAEFSSTVIDEAGSLKTVKSGDPIENCRCEVETE